MLGRAVTSDPLLRRVEGEFREMPGLRLTPAQAARFLSLDRGTCAELLDALVRSRFLARTSDGTYRRADQGA